jgi:hypothetical protein
MTEQRKEENFITIYEDSIAPEYIKKIIDCFHQAQECSLVKSNKNLNRKDDVCYLHEIDKVVNSELNELLTHFARLYIEQYPILESVHLKSYVNKVQRTAIGGGFHHWHSEQMDVYCANRVLTWSMFLNDVDEGGETEFLYQNVRYKPKTGSLLIFPASYTHTHRGNPPISNEKYIVTGWYNLYEEANDSQKQQLW